MTSNNKNVLWRLETHNQGVSRAMLFVKAPREDHSCLFQPSGADSNPWHSWAGLLVCVPVCVPQMDTGAFVSGPTYSSTTSSSPHYICKDPISNKVHIHGYRELGLHPLFGGKPTHNTGQTFRTYIWKKSR